MPPREGVRSMPPGVTLSEFDSRFWQRVNYAGPQTSHVPTRCWLWTGAKRKSGYGIVGAAVLQNGRVPLGAHVVAKMLSEWIRTGTLPHPPKGHDIEVDHLCRIRGCVRPEHLEWVTGRTNRIRQALHRNASARVHRAGSTPVTVTPAGGFCVPGKEGA